tara:strand:+ start:258 stop:470 length:213 start_codon:yes stop_codon:yes gene_type:complete
MPSLGRCFKYDDNTLYVRARTQKDHEFLLAFFRGLGLEFIAEQHGDGESHHSYQCGSRVFEIYPPKVKND